MKLLYIINVEKRIGNFSLSSRLAAHSLGMEVHLAGYWSDYEDRGFLKREEEKYHVRIHQCHIFRKPYDVRNLRGYREVCEIIRREKIDMIHCNTPIGGVIGRLAGKKCGVKKVIYQAHGFHFYKGAPIWNWLIYYPVEKWLARFTDVLITINKEDYGLAIKKIHLRNNGKTVYIPGVGIDLSQYGPGDTEKETNHIVFVSVGELNKNKNHEVVLSALGRLKRKDIHYVLCGTGGLYKRLKILTQRLGLEKQVHFLGFRKDITDILKGADGFILSSFREGLSRSLMEAMACGLPCIVSDIRGNRDLIEHHSGGYRCPCSRPEKFAEALEKIADSKGLADQMREHNLRNISQYDIKAIAGKLKKIYQSERN